MLNHAKMRVWAGDTVNFKNGLGLSSLHIACKEGNSEIVKYLLSKNASVFIKDDEGFTPMHYAC
jgi:ankyrin repeat protein